MRAGGAAERAAAGGQRAGVAGRLRAAARGRARSRRHHGPRSLPHRWCASEPLTQRFLLPSKASRSHPRSDILAIVLVSERHAKIVLCGSHCCMPDPTGGTQIVLQTKWHAVVAQMMRMRWWMAGTWCSGRRCGSPMRLLRRPCLAPMQQNTCLLHPGECHLQSYVSDLLYLHAAQEKCLIYLSAHDALCLMMTAIPRSASKAICQASCTCTMHY